MVVNASDIFKHGGPQRSTYHVEPHPILWPSIHSEKFLKTYIWFWQAGSKMTTAICCELQTSQTVHVIVDTIVGIKSIYKRLHCI